MTARLFLSPFLIVLALFSAGHGRAEESFQSSEEQRDAIAPLIETLRISDLFEIVRLEGLAHSEELERDMFPGRGRERWPGIVARIYEPDRMRLLLADDMASDAPDGMIDGAIAFFETDLGQQILSLELSVREAMLDPSVEAAAQDYLAMLQDDASPRLALLEEFVEINDLVENNVSAALNATFAFYTGLNAAGAFDEIRSEDEILRDIWRQEETIRLDSDLWVMSYLAMAYQPLSDADIRRYIEFGRSAPGQQVNSALFAGFDIVFRTVSREMGFAAAQFIGGSDL